MTSLTSAPHHEEAAPVGGRLWTPFAGALVALIAVMVAVLFVRFAHGLAASTNMSDGYPWGIWIAFDVVVGSALGAGGFAVAFLTYILNRGEYHPIFRPALLAALFGYVQASISVFFDIGRYWEFWHLFAPKYAQVNSALFEVAVCIAAYTLVLFIEFLPIVMERMGWESPRRKLNRVLFIFIALGVLLPTMHQSSLGTVLVVFGPQVHPLYQTNFLPFLFLISCIGMGMAAVVVEGTTSSLAFRRPLERVLLGKLMRVGIVLSAIFLVVRIGDVIVRGALPTAFEPTWPALFFWIENLLFAIPIVLLFSAQARLRAQRLFLGGVSLAVAGIIYRLAAYLIAYNTGAGWHYFPSMGELMVTLGLVAFEILAITFAIRLLPILPKHKEAHQ
ncbi:MAG: Ni/Fe-hydrogenase cytochrome b subunit [Myxococcales bacterium]|nr:Ni/Fe-hydrogenase cytochrome b subunit [Myxococcales bacterium]